jgi:hypothetical protein
VFKNVLFATIKPQGGMNYKVVGQAKIILKPVPTVIHSPLPRHLQADFGCCGTRAVVCGGGGGGVDDVVLTLERSSILCNN